MLMQLYKNLWKKGIDMAIREKEANQTRKLLFYRDRVKGINGNHNKDNNGEEILPDDLEVEKEDVEGPKEDEDPLCPIVLVALEERTEWCKPWHNSLIINLLGKYNGFPYLKA